MEYKGFFGHVEFDDEAGIFHGEDHKNVKKSRGTALLRDYLNGTESIASIARELEVTKKACAVCSGRKGTPP